MTAGSSSSHIVAVVDWVVQSGAGIRVEWGQAGARTLGPHSAALVVVDVLSFTTTVSVAVDAGIAVLPYPWRDGGAEEFAARHDAAWAVGRRAISPERPWSLSSAALRVAPVPRRLVFPSPNGSAIAAAVSGVPVVAACLRNPTAVAALLTRQGWGTTDRGQPKAASVRDPGRKLDIEGCDGVFERSAIGRIPVDGQSDGDAGMCSGSVRSGGRCRYGRGPGRSTGSRRSRSRCASTGEGRAA